MLDQTGSGGCCFFLCTTDVNSYDFDFVICLIPHISGGRRPCFEVVLYLVYAKLIVCRFPLILSIVLGISEPLLIYSQ